MIGEKEDERVWLFFSVDSDTVVGWTAGSHSTNGRVVVEESWFAGTLSWYG